MSLEDLSNHELLTAWRTGNQHAATVLVGRYMARLTALARARLSRRLARRVDPEDIVLSAWRSFFVGAERRGLHPATDDDLWPLLVTLTLRKLSRQVTRHGADRRALDREAAGGASDWTEHIVARDPTPDEAALVSDEVQAVLAALPESARDVFVRTLQGESPGQIARAVGCADRTVRRAMERIRSVIAVRAAEEAESQPATCGPLVLDATAIPTRSEYVQPATEPARLATTPAFDYHALDLQQLVGEGGFGKVYRAKRRCTGETVAVKFLKKSFWKDTRAVESFLREASLLAQLAHPHIIVCRGSGRTPHGAVFLVLDWIDDGDLSQWIIRDRPPIAARLQATMDVAVAVSAAHERGVLHCDLKPANVLRRTDGRIVLTDFGFARAADRLTRRPRGGTAGFLAPEQVSDSFGPVTMRTDVYGLGGLLYALLTGQPPMTGRDVPEVLANVLSSRGPALASSLNPDVPGELDTIVLRCLAKEPSERYASCGEFATELRNLKSFFF